jgi:hypothetical protein
MKNDPNTAVHELMAETVVLRPREHPDGELYFDTGAAVDEMQEGL